jgi:hypothetical protein
MHALTALCAPMKTIDPPELFIATVRAVPVTPHYF